MSRVPEHASQRLRDIQSNIEQSREFFADNYKRYEEFMSFVFYESVTGEERQKLRSIGRPTTEFNVLEAYISRLRGEFAKQSPSLTVRAADGLPSYMLTENFDLVVKYVEAHLRAILFDGNNDSLEYDVYSDLLGGGFSVFEVYTDYVNSMSFDQNIYVGRPYSPLLCGFDPMAQQSHKGDGKFCYALYPKTRKDFEAEYGSKKADTIKFGSSLGGFSWAIKGEKEDIILIADYYEKRLKKTKIYQLANDQVVTQKEYETLIENWNKLEQPPAIKTERWTYLEQIVRYRLCENEVLDYAPTNYAHLPLIFVDGNSVRLSKSYNYSQITRPYVYHAKGVQKLKNFAGQNLGNELENIVQHKFMIAKESIPTGASYQAAYKDVQKADSLVYNYYYKGNPQHVLPAPQPVGRAPMPPEIMQAFQIADSTIQNVLGSYDSALGINDNQLSGVAIANGAMQSNNASVPYLMGYIKGLNRVAEILLDLIPKYYRTPRTIPVLTPSGERSYIQVNNPKNPSALDFRFDSNALQVSVKTGVNFAFQKEASMRTIENLMRASTKFADFINKKGLNFILNNLEVRGIEELKEAAAEYEKEEAQQQQQQQQMGMQMMQENMKLQTAKAEADVQKSQADAMRTMKEAQGPSKGEIDAAKLQLDTEKAISKAEIDQEKIDLDTAELLAKLRNENVDNALEQQRIDAEQARTAVEAMTTMQRLEGDIKDAEQIESREESQGD